MSAAVAEQFGVARTRHSRTKGERAPRPTATHDGIRETAPLTRGEAAAKHPDRPAPASRKRRSSSGRQRPVVVGDAPADRKPFDVDTVFTRLRAWAKTHPKAALFELADDGFDSPFEILVACIISIRTFDEVTIPTARRLFEVARTPADVAGLPVERIDELIRSCTFHEPKARQIRDIAQQVIDRFDGNLPCDYSTLTSFRGVGPKCANLALGIACRQPTGIGVDVHVHRVTNRWGYVHAPSPERTMEQLHERLPRRYWVAINELLVPFGKFQCTGKAPKCSSCPLLSYCQQVGVTEHR